MFTLVLALTLMTPTQNQKTIIQLPGHSVEVSSKAGVQPILATFLNGERSCPSVGSVVLARSCLSKLMSSPFSTNTILANCKHEAIQLGCSQATNDQLVSVRAVYDITVPGQTTDECMIAKVKLGNQRERFVDMASLLFRPDVKLAHRCHLLPSVKVQSLTPSEDQLLTRAPRTNRRAKAIG